MSLRTPSTSWVTALAAPRYGVPRVISFRVISAPPWVMYQRATKPPIEWHTNDTFASRFGPPLARHRSNAGSTKPATRRPLYRLDNRQSYGTTSRFPGGAAGEPAGGAVRLAVVQPVQRASRRGLGGAGVGAVAGQGRTEPGREGVVRVPLDGRFGGPLVHHPRRCGDCLLYT